MNKISETLLVLDHLGRVIESRTKYCIRYINFNKFELIAKRMDEYIEKGYKPKDLGEGEIANQISRECADIRITLHNFSRLNIIDMFSFNDEYNDFFTEVHIENEELKRRIRNVKNKNKEIRKQLDWDQLKRFRNIAMAHNMRDKKNSNRLSFDVLKEINGILMNQTEAVEYSKVVLEIYQNIKMEFEREIIEANNLFVEKVKTLE